MSKGVAKPYLHFIGGNASDVTGSCTIIRWRNYKIAVDCGLIQTNNIVSDYKANRELAKKMKSKDIQYFFITHLHADHVSGLLIAYHQGCQAHIYIPAGSSKIMKIMLEDSAKIMEQDALKIQNKHGIKAAPLATLNDVERVMNRVIELPFDSDIDIVDGLKVRLYPAGHIINSSQIMFTFQDGYIKKRIGFTGDIGAEEKSKSVTPIKPLQKCNIVVGECTYSDPARCYSYKKDRWYDRELIKTAINQYQKILIPVFSLQRCEDILEELANLGTNCPIYLDGPLACKIYHNWPEALDYEDRLDFKLIEEWSQSVELQLSNQHCVILSSSGMLSAGRALIHLKTLLHSSKNAVLFCGYSTPNTLAYEIKNGAKEIKVDGEMIGNNAQIYCLNTFSSHANYHQLMQYYQQIEYDKLCLVHSNFETKVQFAHKLQDELHNQGKSSRVVAVNEDSKIYF